MSEQQRKQIRQHLQNTRNALDPMLVARHSESICQRLPSLIDTAQHIAAYYPLGKEVDLTALLSTLSISGKTVYVPIVLAHYQMLFAPVDDTTALIRNQYGIREPQVDKSLYVDANGLDAVLVPLVGFDKQCNRMGMGGGYYDRCFEQRRQTVDTPKLIGVAFDLQCVSTVYAQDWDVPLDMVVTESRIHTRQSG